MVAVVAAEDFSGELKFKFKSTFVDPTAQAFPAVQASDPGRLVVVIASAAEPVSALVQVRVTTIDVM